MALTVWAMNYADAQERRAATVEACERGNSSRIATLRSLQQNGDDAFVLSGQENDPEIAAIWKHRAHAFEQFASDYIESSAQTGAQSTPGAVTLACDRVVDPVSLNPFG